MFVPHLILLLGPKIALVAPTTEQSNVYRIREAVTATRLGTVVMTGTEKRHISRAVEGRRSVQILFDVKIEDQPTTSVGKRWAKEQLRDLAEADNGFLDDRDALSFTDGVAADAFPIFSGHEVEAGDSWREVIRGQVCRYTLSKIEHGVALIETDSESKAPQGKVHRTGTWSVEVSTGKLVSWHMHSVATYRGGRTETVDSRGELEK